MEGFFDIERGVFLSIFNLLNGLAILTKCKIEIDSYERKEEALNILYTALTLVNDVVSYKLEKEKSKKEESENNNFKDKIFQFENNKKYLKTERKLNNVENKSLKKIFHIDPFIEKMEIL